MFHGNLIKKDFNELIERLKKEEVLGLVKPIQSKRRRKNDRGV